MALKDAPTAENPNRMIPHNPCINAGAIMAVSMVYPEVEDQQTRLKRVLDYWKEFSGGPNAPIGYDEETYLSESGSADRNWCLAYMMREG
jgi:glutaminase